MLQRLAAIHTDIALHLDYGRADREYATAFRDYGIDVDRLPPADAGARIAAAPIAAEMVDALDQWAFVRRVANPRDASKARHLSAVAKAADPDPWRCRLRDALDLEATDRERARAAFEELAATAPEEVLHRESISRLAYALGHLGERETETSLLRRAQRAHPEDFWINYDLARSLMGAGRPDEAVRFYSAAVAIRPRSELARRGLGEALRAAGRTDEADHVPPARVADGRTAGDRAVTRNSQRSGNVSADSLDAHVTSCPTGLARPCERREPCLGSQPRPMPREGRHSLMPCSPYSFTPEVS